MEDSNTRQFLPLSPRIDCSNRPQLPSKKRLASQEYTVG